MRACTWGPGHWASGSLAREGEGPRAVGKAARGPLQELQQKRAQKAGGAKLGPLKGTQETRQPRPAQDPSPRLGDSARQTPKANNTGELGPEAPLPVFVCLLAPVPGPQPLDLLWSQLSGPHSPWRTGLSCTAPRALLPSCPTSSGARCRGP